MVNIFSAKMEDWSKITSLIITMSLIRKQLRAISSNAV